MYRALPLVLFFASFTAMSPQAQAREWTILATGEGFIFSVDKETIVRSSKTIKAWFLYDYPQPVQGENEPVYKSKLEVIYVKCSERTFLRPASRYFSGAKATGEIQYPQYGVATIYTDVVPNSAEELALTYLCRLPK